MHHDLAQFKTLQVVATNLVRRFLAIAERDNSGAITNRSWVGHWVLFGRYFCAHPTLAQTLEIETLVAETNNIVTLISSGH